MHRAVGVNKRPREEGTCPFGACSGESGQTQLGELKEVDCRSGLELLWEALNAGRCSLYFITKAANRMPKQVLEPVML